LISSTAASTSDDSISMRASSAAWTISSSLTISSSIWVRSLSKRRRRSLASAMPWTSPTSGVSRALSSLSRTTVSLTTATTRSTMAARLALAGALGLVWAVWADAGAARARPPAASRPSMASGRW
jgi:hypothetical protein